MSSSSDYQVIKVERPNGNFSIAEFSCWRSTPQPKAVVIMTPGSNGDGREWVTHPAWRDFATSHHLALVGCYLADKVPSWVETYVNVKGGSGDALLEALERFGLKHIPLLLWGFSAGGEFNFELACWLAPRQPKLIKAFVVNKGGIYYSALAPPEARDIPAIFFIGAQDVPWRQDVLHGIFAVNAVAGCQWTKKVEDAGHELGFSTGLAMKLFTKALESL